MDIEKIQGLANTTPAYLEYILGIGLLLYIIFWLLEKFNIYNPISTKLDEIKDIAQRQLDINNKGYLLHPEQTKIVKDYIFGRLPSFRNLIIRVIMDGYLIKDKDGGDDRMKDLLKEGFMAAINDVDGQLSQLPNIKQHSSTKERKLQVMMSYADNFIIIFKEEDNEDDVARRVRGMIDTIVRNNDDL